MRRRLALALMAICAAFPAYGFRGFVIYNDVPVQPSVLRFMSSAPYANQRFDRSPAVISITFSMPVQPDKSSIRLYDLFGTPLNDGRVLSTDGMTLSVPLPPLASGAYSVKWKARCQCDADTEISDAFRFTVQ
jgi:hypothetical protein